MARRRFTLLIVLLSLTLPPKMALGQFVCQLGPSMNPFNPALNQPPTPYAAQEVQTIYQLLCPAGCGHVQLFLNETTPNAMAMAVRPGASMITYASAFMNHLIYNIGPEASFGVMAHEFGHHIDFHTTPSWMNNSWSRELKADAWAGCALARRGFQPSQIAIALQAIAAYPSPSHPAWNLRIPAVQRGFVSCGGQANWLPW